MVLKEHEIDWEWRGEGQRTERPMVDVLQIAVRRTVSPAFPEALRDWLFMSCAEVSSDRTGRRDSC